MVIKASEFKAKCLALIDRVRKTGEPIIITKRGKAVARLVPEGDVDQKPWLKLRGTVTWHGDHFAPVVEE